ncbi:hypothetical protein SAOR_15335 [Salinisphaera orenii MK-B5]|uniref:Structural protein MipA n=1 Tax=Salinisphaera orenii MK-B5 TaxID=856730 RepID=A0A423PFF2_9GAMM|nr:hypothetical protein [Salinisphaera orenii]ROO24295.1 hypothetical protein SAOR_15335 [Salinisphaera orenii MK-B5]
MSKKRTSATPWLTALLLCGACGTLQAQTADSAPNSDAPPEDTTMAETPPSPGEHISGTVGFDYASHFISYGGDVWGAGDEFYGTQSTTFGYVDLGVDLPNGFALTLGAWSDINNNAENSIGGNIQEIDVYGGLTYTTGAVTLGAVYQQWYYGGDTERVLDLSVGLDDSGFWGDSGFALNPSFVSHIRVNGQESQDDGAAFVGSVEPGVTLSDDETLPLSLAFPASIGFMTDDFQGGDGGFGYASIGATLGIGLDFIPVGYGDWSVAVNTTYYHTEEDVIPGNPEEDFVTGTVGIAMAF